MTVIRPNSISGVTSITAHGGDITYFKSDGTRGNQFTHNVSSTGVITATKFVGSLEATTGTFSQSVDVSGDKILNIPSGTTAERAGVPLRGNLRYNTSDAKLEFYDGNNWKNIGSSQPLVSSISPTTYDGTAGTIITIFGKDFESGVNVHFVSSANGSSTAAGVVTFTNSSTLTAVLPALTTAGEPYGVRVTNPDGGQT